MELERLMACLQIAHWSLNPADEGSFQDDLAAPGDGSGSTAPKIRDAGYAACLAAKPTGQAMSGTVVVNVQETRIWGEQRLRCDRRASPIDDGA